MCCTLPSSRAESIENIYISICGNHRLVDSDIGGEDHSESSGFYSLSIDLRNLWEYELNKNFWQPVCLHIPEFELANDLGRAGYDLSRTFGSQVPDVVALFNT